jgi:hypothetical protein
MAVPATEKPDSLDQFPPMVWLAVIGGAMQTVRSI